MLALIRRMRVAWWLFGLRLRLQRHGVHVSFVLGSGMRWAGRPRLEVIPMADERGGSVTLAFGSDLRVGRDLVLDVRPGADHVVEIGEGAVLQDHVRLQLRGGAIRIGDNTQVRDGCELKSAGELKIGARVVCGRGSTFHCERAITVGSRAALAERVTILDSDHGADGSDAWVLAQPLLVDPVEVGDNVLVGANVTLLRGARIGRNSVVAAGAVVMAGEYPTGWVIGGTPAKPLKSLGG